MPTNPRDVADIKLAREAATTEKSLQNSPKHSDKNLREKMMTPLAVPNINDGKAVSAIGLGKHI